MSGQSASRRILRAQGGSIDKGLVLALILAVAGAAYYYAKLEMRVEQLEKSKAALEDLKAINIKLDSFVCEQRNGTFDFITLICKPVPQK